MHNNTLRKIPGLDGLRGIAASIVLLTHMSNWGYNFAPSLDFTGIGRSGVILFFVLSSFLLTSQALKWDSVFSIKNWGKYAISRTFRILPLFFVVLIISLITAHIGEIPILWMATDYLHDLPVPMSYQSFINHIIFLEGTDMMWTIPIEFKFYLILPVILILIIYTYKENYTLILSSIFIYLIYDYIFLSNTQNGTDTMPFISVFTTGILCAFAYNYTNRLCSLKTTKLFFEVGAWLILIFYIIIIPDIFEGLFGTIFPETLRLSNAFFATLWGTFILFMLHGTGHMSSILSSRPLVFLGAISYSIYLLHRIPIKLTHRLNYYNNIDFLNTELKALLIFSTSIILSYAAYRIIEMPSQNIGNKLKLIFFK